MKRNQIVLLVALALAGALVGVLAWHSRQPPVLPADRDHAGFNTLGCMECHGPQGKSPQGKNHPVGDDCLRCHGTP